MVEKVLRDHDVIKDYMMLIAFEDLNNISNYEKTVGETAVFFE